MKRREFRESSQPPNVEHLSPALPRIFALPVFIQSSLASWETTWRGRFLCMLWRRDYLESRAVSRLWSTSARNGAA